MIGFSFFQKGEKEDDLVSVIGVGFFIDSKVIIDIADKSLDFLSVSIEG